MLNGPAKENESCSLDSRLRPVKFLTSLFKKKKVGEISCDVIDRNMQPTVHVSRIPSTLSVKDVLVATCPTSPTTPARQRDLDADMEALRVSRHDNPFLKQVLASRESLADSLEESESDDTNLMSQDLMREMETDPFSLPEVHEHMIRSPPPTSWPRSPNFRLFRFPESEHSSQENLHRSKSPGPGCGTPKLDQRMDPVHDDILGRSILSPKFSLPSRPHQRSAGDIREKNLSLLSSSAGLRSLTDVRRLKGSEDSQYLVPSDSSS